MPAVREEEDPEEEEKDRRYAKIGQRDSLIETSEDFDRWFKSIQRLSESKLSVGDTLDLKSRGLGEGGIDCPRDEVDCHAVRYGYAIPVDVLPIPDNPKFAELVVDRGAISSPVNNYRCERSDYQEHHRVIYRCEDKQEFHCENKAKGEVNNSLEYRGPRETRMAATAKHEQLRGKFPTESSSGEEDIAAIAKQISDHAEAIYQTWKSRGLAPTEILNCHSNATAADKFGSALTPTTSVTGGGMSNAKKSLSPSNSAGQNAVEIIAQSPGIDNNNLEKLVNNFVVEDRARLAAAGRRSPAKNLPSSIQFALQKFERNSTPHTSPVKTPTGSNLTAAIVKPQIQAKASLLTSPTCPYPGKPSQIAKPLLSPKTPTSSHHNEIFLETIETTYPADLTPSKILVQQKRPVSTVVTSQTTTSASTVTENSSSGLTTWPLKNKVTEPRRVANSVTSNSIGRANSPCKEDGYGLASRISPTSAYNVNSYLDEVAREEERLINALKTGAVITDDASSSSDRSTVSNAAAPVVARQKPAIKKEKPKVEPVKQIIIGPAPVSNNSAVIPNSATPASAILVNSVVTAPQINSTPSPSDPKSEAFSSALSTAGYTRKRYRVAQQKIDEQKTPAAVNNSEQLVASTRTKFENDLRKDSPDNGKDERDFVTSRWGPRLNSPRPRLDQVPHPELTTQQKQHIRAAAATGTGNNPVRPFLTRGSVAERVLIFEKCPSELLLDKRGPRQPPVNTWRTGHEVQNKAQTYSRDKSQQKGLPPHTTLQRHVKANRNVHIPRFYFPGGKPPPLSQVEATIANITAAFQSLPGHRASRAQFFIIPKACDLPFYWKVPLFLAAGGEKNGFVEMSAFLDYWKELTSTCHDAASKFVRIITRGLRNTIIPEDLIPLVQDVVETHPGLIFLKEATEFHSRYVHTVIARIFYCVNRSWSGKISVAELRRSNLLAVISILQHEEDINQVTAYFSYEHFYVIYCKFWELDRDHDLFIDKMDLMRHNDHALSTRLIERIFILTRGGVKSGGTKQPEDKMSYTEFVWFLLSEEDKNHPTAIEYWFRCMDLDGDGYLSMYELEYFYEEQLQRMEAIKMETLPFEDCLCQMLDMIHPATPGKISLSDLKKCKMTSIFFDTFFNLEKYLDHEQRDPFASTRDHDADGEEFSDWDRFAADEYELLVAEENANDQNEQTLCDDEM
ncbi:uncharacterized protein [Venturia canescens]|uniref:uncharacterized protein isoform X2 n=1 Tax=Venturia canescens TaxID=32260 RepID=UPI001C9C147B|nr:uncharacterized protein LOC122410297 isoform X2 [Venturia canescens]XP_043274394.1 uncharacterized protein LOC122410297 isoform X2 [Venturia canescens]